MEDSNWLAIGQPLDHLARLHANPSLQSPVAYALPTKSRNFLIGRQDVKSAK